MSQEAPLSVNACKTSKSKTTLNILGGSVLLLLLRASSIPRLGARIPTSRKAKPKEKKKKKEKKKEKRNKRRK